MLNPVKGLYVGMNREVTLDVPTVNAKLEWSQLSTELHSGFGSRDGKPVGELISDGVEFKLDYLNYFPIVPTVRIIQTVEGLTISRFYDKKAKWSQIYWMTIFVLLVFLMPLFLVLEFTNPHSDMNVEDISVFVFFEFLFLIMLALFAFQRRRLWRKSLEKANQLLKILTANNLS